MSPYFGYATRLLATSGIDYTYVRMAMYMDHQTIFTRIDEYA